VVSLHGFEYKILPLTTWVKGDIASAMTQGQWRVKGKNSFQSSCSAYTVGNQLGSTTVLFITGEQHFGYSRKTLTMRTL
jgi:hypothetical protein